jgi:hypothetical protein
MALRPQMQLLGRHFAENVTQIEVGVGDVFNVAATDLTEVTLLAACHVSESRVASYETVLTSHMKLRLVTHHSSPFAYLISI